MNFNSILKAVNPDAKEDNNKEASSSPGLMTSAKVLGDAASAAYRHETDKIDKTKVADAAGDVLGAVSDHAKLDNTTTIGQYVDKAENYLHSYNKPSSTPPPPPTATPAAPPAAPAAVAEDEPKSGAAGDYLKMAEGLFKH